MDLGRQATRIGALADPLRRALYEYVAAQRGPVGREQAATALDLPMHSVKFHLDRLVEADLLSTTYRRLGDRSGPGAGRPSKLYQRTDEQVVVSLPERRYDLAGHILAAGVERATRGEPLEQALATAADEAGRSIGATVAPGGPREFEGVLAAQGYEPRVEGDTMLLANCPFDTLADEHTELVCGLNLSFVQGVADGVGCHAVASLEPEPGLCCVKARLSRSA
jgi:predicted ArsR family transcriptional regulator